MKLVIDIPKEMYERIKDGYVPLGISKYLKNGTPLPEDATNGDIFKAMFSNLTIYENRDNKDYPYVEVFIGEHDSTCYPKEWWDTPYREGDNDAEH